MEITPSKPWPEYCRSRPTRLSSAGRLAVAVTGCCPCARIGQRRATASSTSSRRSAASAVDVPVASRRDCDQGGSRPRRGSVLGSGTTSSGSILGWCRGRCSCGAGAVGRVERERSAARARRASAVVARHAARRSAAPAEHPSPRDDECRRRGALGEAERRLDRVGRGRAATSVSTTRRSTTTSMSCLSFFFSSGELSSGSTTSPSTRTRTKPSAWQLLEQLAVLALAAAHDRRQHLERVALRQLSSRSTICSRASGRHPRSALVAVRRAGAREQQAQVVVDLGDRADGRARVARRSSSARSRSPGESPRSSRRRASPSARGTAARRPRATRRSVAGPRRRSCRTPATTCPSPRRPVNDDQPVARKVEIDVAGGCARARRGCTRSRSLTASC